jgi:hypothetical protein
MPWQSGLLLGGATRSRATRPRAQAYLNAIIDALQRYTPKTLAGVEFYRLDRGIEFTV